MMLFRVTPGKIVPSVAGVEITLPYNREMMWIEKFQTEVRCYECCKRNLLSN